GARRHVPRAVLAALRLVFRLARSVPLLLPERRRSLSDLRGQLALHRALAAAPLRRAVALRRVLRDPGSRALLPSLSEKGGAPWVRGPRLEHFPEKWTPVSRRKCDHEGTLESIPAAISRASASRAPIARNGF